MKAHFSGILILSPLINQKTITKIIKKTKNKQTNKQKQQKTKQNKNVRVEPPLTKISGSEHALCMSPLIYIFYFNEMSYCLILLNITEQLKKYIK